jgi:hypothetical protein
MGEIKIIYKSDLEIFFNNLIYDLYVQEYFGFLESAIEYKEKIIRYIKSNIGKALTREAPEKLKYLGSQYFFYKMNSYTTWFIFYEQKESNYLITGIFNNHYYLVKYLN